MELTAKVKLQPFNVPNYVLTVAPTGRRQDGMVETPKFHIGELDNETLDALCLQFRNDVRAKAEEYRAAKLSLSSTGT